MNTDSNVDSDYILCYLNEFTDLITSHSKEDKQVQYRYGIVARSNSWALIEYRNTGTQVYHKFTSCLNDLCPYFRIICNLDVYECLEKIRVALYQRTQIQVEPAKKPQIFADLLQYASLIDKAYQINYAIDDDIRERLFV